MRPSDYQIPLRRLQGHTVIHDRVVHLTKPKCDLPESEKTFSNDFIFPPWDHPDIFGNSNPVHVEYCSGNGAWIAARAAAYPQINWVAVEIKFGRTRKIWAKIQNLNLKNLLVVNGEAAFATATYFPQQSVSAIYINFPDPWPKRHHFKNRLIQPYFVNSLSQLLKENGEVMVVTDDPMFSEWTLKVFRGSTHFDFTLAAPYYTTEWPNYGNSYFETIWREQGRTIRYHHFLKKSA